MPLPIQLCFSILSPKPHRMEVKKKSPDGKLSAINRPSCTNVRQLSSAASAAQVAFCNKEEKIPDEDKATRFGLRIMDFQSLRLAPEMFRCQSSRLSERRRA